MNIKSLLSQYRPHLYNLTALTASLGILTVVTSCNWADKSTFSSFRSEPAETILMIDVSSSSSATNKLDDLSITVCENIKSNVKAGDKTTYIPFAANSITSHSRQLESRLDILSLCKPEHFAEHLTAERGVALVEGTSLHETLVGLKHKAISVSDTGEQGQVLILIVHADDQGVGAEQAVSLADTAKVAESLLKPQTALVIFAIDGQLQRQLENLLKHPQSRVSALSEESVADSLDWAYRIARKPQE